MGSGRFNDGSAVGDRWGVVDLMMEVLLKRVNIMFIMLHNQPLIRISSREIVIEIQRITLLIYNIFWYLLEILSD